MSHPAEQHQFEAQLITEQFFVVDTESLKKHHGDQCEEQHQLRVVLAGCGVVRIDQKQEKAR